MKKMTYQLLLFVMVWFPLTYSWQGHVIPIAFDNGLWKILLVHDRNVLLWSDFRKDGTGSRKKGNVIAAQALAVQTNNMYHVNPADLKYFPIIEEKRGRVYFVKVPFIRGKELYENARTAAKDDFAWVAIADIVAGKLLQTPRGKPIQVGKTTKEILQFIKNYYEAILAALTEPIEAMPSAKNCWLNIPGAIYFYESGKPYFEFTNFARYPVVLDGEQWPTTEHYYQAQKFIHHPDLQNKIRNLKTPREALDFARRHKNEIDPDWHDRSISVMLTAVRAKFNQHATLQKLLVDTGNVTIVENAGQHDNFYGAGADGKGRNVLGQILMRVRAELQGVVDPGDDFICYPNAADYFAGSNGEVCTAGIVTRPQTEQRMQPQESELEKKLTTLKSALNNLLALLTGSSSSSRGHYSLWRVTRS